MNGTELKQLFGQRLAQLRNDRLITQEELAEDCEVSSRTIRDIERGQYGTRFELIASIAVRLNVPVQELFIFDDLQQGA